MSHVLVLTHCFPPSGGAGARRVTKMVKYLSRLGWRVTVVCPRRGVLFVYPYDPGLVVEIPPEVRIQETYTPESRLVASSRSAVAGAGTRPEGGAPARRRSSYRRYLRVFKHLAIPDSALLWVPFAIRSATRVARREKVDVILVTGPPFSTLMAGALAGRLCGIPVVSEFRDGWTADPARVRIFGRGIRRKIEEHEESWVVRCARRVVSMTEGVTCDFVTKYASRESQAKFCTIPNGYDPEDAQGPAQGETQGQMSDSDRRVHVVYTGTLGGVRTPKHFLQALSDLVRSHEAAAQRLHVTFVGQCDRFCDGGVIEDYVADLGLAEQVTVAGFVSRKESIAYQRQADVLLLIVGVVDGPNAIKYGLSAKAFDYALAKRPVLAVAGDGPTADFVRHAGIGEVVAHEDRAAIVSSLRRAVRGDLHYAPDASYIAAYDYRALAKRLSEVLSGAAGRE